MACGKDPEELQDTLEKLASRAASLYERGQALKDKSCQNGNHGIEGINKLMKKIQAEQSFIRSLQQGQIPVKENHLKSTNLSHLEAVIFTAESFSQVTSVLRPVHYLDEYGAESTLLLDVVGHGGRAWIKITARKPKALHRIWQGEGEYGEHDIIEQASQYAHASQQHLINYSPPTVHVVFYAGIIQAIADELQDVGAMVHGHIFASEEESESIKPDPPKFSLSDPENSLATMPVDVDNFTKVNLDVTTLIALVSELTHGGCWYEFPEPLIRELAEQERLHPLLPELNSFLQGKELHACKTALNDFQNILKTIAGPNEKDRATKLIARITPVEDCLSDRAVMLEGSNKIKSRAKTIFGTGDHLHAVTTTANVGFLRAATNQGVNFTVHIHQSRALTEKKQNSAACIDSSPPAANHEEHDGNCNSASGAKHCGKSAPSSLSDQQASSQDCNTSSSSSLGNPSLLEGGNFEVKTTPTISVI